VILAGDIGGTKTTLGLFDGDRRADDRDAPVAVERRTYPSRDQAGLGPLLRVFLDEVGAGRRITAACFGVAGPCIDGRVETPNLPWVIDAAQLAGELDVARVELINDLVATAEGIPALTAAEQLMLNPGRPVSGSRRPRALIAAGTGLGMALLAPSATGWTVHPSEGGHADYAPNDDDEIALLRFLMKRFPGHVSAERVVSGSAIPSLYEFARAHHPEWVEQSELAAAFAADPVAAVPLISKYAIAGGCRVASFTMRLFVRGYGAVAGNLALTGFATGGLFVGGGIAGKILPLLERGDFMQAFTAKGRFTGFNRDVPVAIIRNPETALLGAARRAWADRGGATPTPA